MNWAPVRQSVLLALVLWLAGMTAACGSSSGGTSKYGQVDAIADKLNLGSLGKVVEERNFGNGGVSSDAPTRRVAIISDASVLPSVTQSISGLGFTPSSPHVWAGTGAESAVQITLTEIPVGQSLGEGSSVATVPAGKTGLVVSVSSGA